MISDVYGAINLRATAAVECSACWRVPSLAYMRATGAFRAELALTAARSGTSSTLRAGINGRVQWPG
jgi:hypothetical protein